ncbi:MAG: hypothetical protein PHQ91_12335 [Thermoanaerobaculaceae bacterium]|nr:hypothetical protein [Thermoanaerobaculaceae bacterium]
MSGAMRLDILGVPFTTDDGRLVVRAIAHAALTAYVPYMILPGAQSQTIDGTTTVQGAAYTGEVDAVATVWRQWGVPQRSYAIGEIAELQCGGPGKLMVSNVTAAISYTSALVSDFLKLIAGTTTTAAQTDAGGAETNSSIARTCEAYNAAPGVAIQVQFIPSRKVINT